MKTLLRFLPLLCLSVATLSAASDDKIIAAVRAADDERIAATIAGDAKRLAASYSDDLHYGHSNGRNDNKESQIKGLTTGGNKYQKFEHKERTFTVVAPNVVIGKGHVLMYLTTRSGEKVLNDLNYLSVWRNENGQWRFLAWQSCKNPPAETPAKK